MIGFFGGKALAKPYLELGLVVLEPGLRYSLFATPSLITCLALLGAFAGEPPGRYLPAHGVAPISSSLAVPVSSRHPGSRIAGFRRYRVRARSTLLFPAVLGDLLQHTLCSISHTE